MRILLDQGIFDMRNIGQNALLQVAYERVSRIWPSASIGITTFAPNLMKMYFPNAQPVSPDGQNDWFRNQGRFNKFRFQMPGFLLRLLLEIREELWHKWPGLSVGALRSKLHSWMKTGKENHSMRSDCPDHEVSGDPCRTDYASVISGYDLVIATGSQYLTDIARDAGIGVLDRLETAIHLGIPTAMVGQGIGPVDDPDLRARAESVLPLINLIFVRERLYAPNLLSSMGVDPAKIFVTGDDAIELAYRSRIPRFGSGIGVSLRVMPYTEVEEREIEIVSTAIKAAAEKYGAQLVGLPISQSIHERDDRCTQQIMNGYSNVRMNRSNFQTPVEVIKNTQRCRIVITGTFHAAVFALAQGIPAICLAKAASYVNKLTGLADQFNPGCEVIFLDDEHLQEKLITAIDTAWQSAEQFRPNLLEAAAHQIDLGQSAYRLISELVGSN